MKRAVLNRLKARMKGVARRQRELFFPDRATRDYRIWMASRLQNRAALYPGGLEPGLLSIVTAVWDGSPISFLRELFASIAGQIEAREVEWFLLMNGCKRLDLLACLDELGRESFVTLHRSDENLGIVRGLRLCLEKASGRYVLPVDADDKLYPDALRIVTNYIQQNNYPPLLYTDEDKISGYRVYQPYFKPNWDPVLLANSAYIAHLGVVDRRLALDLDAYSEPQAEGSPDWDLFVRAASNGHRGIHIPEVVYSWRIHAHSTADDAATKPYIQSSQRAVMKRWLAAQPAGQRFEVHTNQLFGEHAPHLRCRRRTNEPKPPVFVISRAETLEDLVEPARIMSDAEGIVALTGKEIETHHQDEDYLGLFELFPEVLMVGGRLSNPAHVIVDGAQQFGFNGICGCPDAGRHVSDPGYFGQMWKQRCASAVSARLAFVRGSDLLRMLERLPREATLDNLGCWMGAIAFRDGRTMVYSPFLHGTDRRSTPSRFAPAEEESFRASYSDLIPDRRFYPAPFSLESGYRLPHVRL